MQLKELKLAEEYGEKALAIATEKDYKDILKNCYYLLARSISCWGTSSGASATSTSCRSCTRTSRS